MKIKEAKICENGDFEVTVSFTSNEIREVGFDSPWVTHSKQLIQAILERINKIKDF